MALAAALGKTQHKNFQVPRRDRRRRTMALGKAQLHTRRSRWCRQRLSAAQQSPVSILSVICSCRCHCRSLLRSENSNVAWKCLTSFTVAGVMSVPQDFSLSSLSVIIERLWMFHKHLVLHWLLNMYCLSSSRHLILLRAQRHYHIIIMYRFYRNVRIITENRSIV